MTFPKNSELKNILKELKDSEPTLVIDFEKSSKSDILKYQICQEFVKILKADGLSQKELATKLGVDKSIVSKIVHHRIENFTLDRLIDLLALIKDIDVFLRAG